MGLIGQNGRIAKHQKKSWPYRGVRNLPSRGSNGRSGAVGVGSPIFPVFGPRPDTPQVTRACRAVAVCTPDLGTKEV